MKSLVTQLNEGKTIVMPVRASSNISTWAYSPQSKVLTILFKKGYTYRYYNVDKKNILKLLNVKSTGKEFMKNIYGKFKYERLNNANQCTTEIF